MAPFIGGGRQVPTAWRRKLPELMANFVLFGGQSNRKLKFHSKKLDFS